jgi:hypothetical protein
MGGADARGRRGLGEHVYAVAFAAQIGLPDDRDLPALEVQADAAGRFRVSLFSAGSYQLRVRPPQGEPYLTRTVTVRWPQGAVVRKVVDVELVRGVPVRGRVTEAPGGQAVAGARVDFWSKGLKLPPGVRQPRSALTGPDGTFEALLPPASWHLLVNGPLPAYVLQPVPIDKLSDEVPPPRQVKFTPDGKNQTATKKQPVRGPSQEAKASPEAKVLAVFQADPKPPRQFYPDAWLTLDVKAGDTPKVAVTLRRAPLLRGRVVGPDGKPASGVLLLRRPALPFEEVAYGDAFTRRAFLDLTGEMPPATAFYALDASIRSGRRAPAPVELRDGTFSIPVLDPRASYPLYFLDAKRKQGALIELQGKQGGKEVVTVRLASCGSARARLVDAKGKGLANYRPRVELLMRPGSHPAATDAPQPTTFWTNLVALETIRHQPARQGPATDAQGQLTLPELIPGATYRLWLDERKAREFTVRSGETLDLGELTAERPPDPRAVPRAKDVGAPRKTKTKPNP